MRTIQILLLLICVSWHSTVYATSAIGGIYTSASVEAQIIVLDSKKGTVAASLVATAINCFSGISGIGELKGRVLKFSPVEKQEGQAQCEVEFEFDDSWKKIYISESGCPRYRLKRCPFDGQTATRQPIPRDSLPPAHTSSSSETNPNQARVAAISIVGKYELATKKQSSTQSLQLACDSETSCVLTTVLDASDGPRVQDRQMLKKVREVGVPVHARNALHHAILERNKVIKNEEFAETMNHLRPIRSRNPSISKCWDLNYPSLDYMLACKLSIGNAELPEMYLFGTLLSNCGEAFCRYVINPMTPVK